MLPGRLKASQAADLVRYELRAAPEGDEKRFLELLAQTMDAQNRLGYTYEAIERPNKRTLFICHGPHEFMPYVAKMQFGKIARSRAKARKAS